MDISDATEVSNEQRKNPKNGRHDDDHINDLFDVGVDVRDHVGGPKQDSNDDKNNY